ncbi:MAG: aspartate/glutamate racemase family protein [Gammaproteobacteria bacterium]
MDYRFLLMQAFSLPSGSKYTLRPMSGTKETMLMNYADLAPLLENVTWDLHPGAPAPHGDWPVETREEFCLLSASRLPIVREACESGKYNAIVMLGGGDPGYPEAREIGRKHAIPVTANAYAQMHLASILGNKFSIIDISETHNMMMHALVVQYGFTSRCASIRNINFPLPRPPYVEQGSVLEERDKARRGERSEMLESAVEESVAAIEEDGAEVLMLGCSAAFWLRPFLQKRLEELGWEIPVLEGYSSGIAQAKMLVDMKLSVSGLALPGSATKRMRRKKTF